MYFPLGKPLRNFSLEQMSFSDTLTTIWWNPQAFHFLLNKENMLLQFNGADIKLADYTIFVVS